MLAASDKYKEARAGCFMASIPFAFFFLLLTPKAKPLFSELTAKQDGARSARRRFLPEETQGRAEPSNPVAKTKPAHRADFLGGEMNRLLPRAAHPVDLHGRHFDRESGLKRREPADVVSSFLRHKKERKTSFFRQEKERGASLAFLSSRAEKTPTSTRERRWESVQA